MNRMALGMARGRRGRGWTIAIAGLLSCSAMTGVAQAQAQAPERTSEEPAGEDIVVNGSLNALPVDGVGSIFGFDKTLVETPRSASTISKEQIERFGITDIYDLVAQAPGTFTNSFFGVGGALDIRGTPGEVYFRGVRRLDNPGNYPTPIGASDRIDIVRGPASPIYGPSKTGGYMNFVPKSARVKGGALMDRPAGEITYTGGSWDRNVLSANLRGPAKIGKAEFGYSLYAEIEDSGSYYRNMSTKQTILQAAFDNDVTDTVRIEFGGMYHNFKGQQNGGWNRLTQDLVDNGTYITGSAQPLDTNGDGQISPAEFDARGTFSPFGTFGCAAGTVAAPSPFAASFTDACFQQSYPQLALTNVGTAKLSRRDVLTGRNDRLDNKAKTGYFDIIFNPGNDLEVKNQLFYDGYYNINENTYGFAQFHDSWVIEDKIVVSKAFTTNAGKFSFQLSPSIRYTSFKHGEDFTYEYFHRVDLTQGYNALSDRLLATESGRDYTDYVLGHYTNYAIAALADLDFNFGLDLTLGGRYDSVTAVSRNDPTKIKGGTAASARGTKGGWSWTASASYKLPFGLIPYATAAQQTTLIAGQGAEIAPGGVASGNWFSASRLYEGGVKASLLDDKLYAAVSVYKQKRTDFNAQAIVTNQAVETRGVEAEARWAVDRHLLLSAGYTHVNVYNLTGLETGSLFSFFGIEDLVNVRNPALYLGGQPIGLVPIPDREASRRQGIPKNLYSLTGSYSFDNGIALTGSLVSVDSVFSGQSQKVRLPAYALVDLGASYTVNNWLFRVVVKNVTNKQYFRANFTELFGGTIVLPERPRSVQGSLVYKF